MITSTVLIVIVLATSALWWYFGIFSKYNYFAAKRDIKNGNVKFITFGLPMPSSKDHEIDILMARYGFKDSNIGCVVTQQEINAISAYNSVVEQYLLKRNGKGWRDFYQNEVDSLYKIAFSQTK